MEQSVDGGVLSRSDTETSAADAVACVCGVSIEVLAGSGGADPVITPTGDVGVSLRAVFSCARRSRRKGHSGERSICL